MASRYGEQLATVESPAGGEDVTGPTHLSEEHFGSGVWYAGSLEKRMSGGRGQCNGSKQQQNQTNCSRRKDSRVWPFLRLDVLV